MSITVKHQPSAAAVGNAAYIGGIGQYERWLKEQRLRQQQVDQQFALQQQQADLARANMLAQNARAMQQIGFQAWNADQGRQADLQRAWMGGQFGLQERVLAAQNQQQMANQEFGQRMQLAQQAQAAALEQNTDDNTAYMDRLKFQQQAQENAKWQDKLYGNPFAEHDASTKQYTDQGYTFTPDQQARLKRIRADISGLQEQVQKGNLSTADAVRAFRPLYGQLMGIQPQTKEETTLDVLRKKVVLNFPGLEGTPVTVDEKGTPQVIRGWKPGDGSGSNPLDDKTGLNNAKVEGQRLKNQVDQSKVETQWWDHKQKFINNRLNAQKDAIANGVITADDAHRFAAQEWDSQFGGKIPSQQQAPQQPAQGATAGGQQPGGPPQPLPEQTVAKITQAYAGAPQKTQAAMFWAQMSQTFGRDASKWPPEYQEYTQQAARLLFGGAGQ